MQRIWKDRTFVSMFITILACIIAIEVGLFGFFYDREMKIQDEKYNEVIDNAIVNVRDYLDTMFQNEQVLARQLKSTTWVVKLSADSDVFEDEFDPLRIKEISQDYLFGRFLNSEIIARSVYFTNREYVIHSGGGNGTKFYFESMGVPMGQSEEFVASLKDITHISYVPIDSSTSAVNPPNKLFVIAPIQETKGSRAYLCTFFSVPQMMRHIEQILPVNFSGVSIMDHYSSNTLFQIARDNFHADTDKQQKVTMSLAPWELTFYIDSDAATGNITDMYRLMISAFAFLMGGIMVAYLLAQCTVRPLKRLLRLFPEPGRSDDVFLDVEHHIHSVLDDLQEAQKETTMRNLLSGVTQSEDQIIKSVPFKQKMWMRVLLIECDRNDQRKQKVASILDVTLRGRRCLYYEILSDITDSLILVVGAMEKEELELLKTRLNEKLGDLDCVVFVGRVEYGFDGISRSFHSAVEKKSQYNYLSIPNFYLPTDVERQFLSALRSGKEKGVAEVLETIREENIALLKKKQISSSDVFQLTALLVNDLVRIAREMKLDVSMTKPLELLDYNSIEGLFQTISGVALAICDTQKSYTEVGDTEKLRIINYINEHYTDCEFSIITLQDALGLSANTINRNLRTLVGKTFLPYLMYLRMEKAKELLSVEGSKVSEVYKLVGYTNAYSFRRAFSRYTGYRSQNYVCDDELNIGQEDGDTVLMDDSDQ